MIATVVPGWLFLAAAALPCIALWVIVAVTETNGDDE